MKTSLLEYLACPRCRGALRCDALRADGDEVLEGTLGCAACAAAFPIRGGIPRILPDALSARERATSRAFGAQWKMLAGLSTVFRAEFQSYLDPLPASELRGLAVLDAGCGMGKFSFAAAESGARAVVAVDLSEAVEVAYANLRALPNAHVVQGSIAQPPFRAGAFDFAFSIGVLHHTPDPEKSFQQLVPLVRPGGRLFVWLYALEGNEFFVRWVDPLRAAVFSRLPSWLNRAAATAMALPLWAVIRLVYVPLGPRAVALRLPYAEYFLYFSRLGLRAFWGTVYDKLVPPVSFYLTRDEVRRWLADAGLAERSLRHRNGNSWSCLARRERPA
ncbi:MAG TPA: methyltransferase domain-containing protein [Methylomirabilota bacterium]|nr:methyltransferase domain-containing protein [Methylomirabilota bacterium]